MKLAPDIVLEAYRQGIFPMADARKAKDIHWFDPVLRGILPIETLHVPRRLRRVIRQARYAVTFDTAFEEVIRHCADARPDTWINDEIIALYTALYRRGDAHSVEAWRENEDGTRALVGGLYGISIGGAFFGESMFSTATDASKVALVHLAARLWRQGFSLLDTQFVNDHLTQFGVMEISRAEYHRRLKIALAQDVRFGKAGENQSCGSSVEGAASSVPLSSSKEPGNCSRSRGVSPGRAPEGAGDGLAAEGAGVSDLTSSDLASDLGAGFAPSGGTLPGACSEENAASSLTDVLAFLQSMTQTS
ncbi:MAG: leucyl/phenylalanyl-tRNA--protein transferase [Alphaproteobacteria bacterium]|nr:leucyl/phenylalanyl-tRNA--protein transferase [Alphaproteobacteria bacterium]